MRTNGHVEEFLYYEKAAGKAEATLRIRRRSLRTLCEWLADHDLDLTEVTSADLVAFVNSLLGRHVPDAVNQYISSARLLFRWLAEEEIIPASPAARLRFMRPPVKPVESLSDADCRRLVSWCVTRAPKERFGVHRTAALALLLLDTGVRIGEALRLTLGDVDFAEGKLLVHATKTNDFRVLPLSPPLRRPLRRCLQRREAHLQRRGVESDLLFVSESGRGCSSNLLLHGFDFLARAAGIGRHLHPHLLRHTFATKSLRNGAPLPAVMRLGGWRRLSTVARYTYMDDQMLAEVHAASSPLSKL